MKNSDRFKRNRPLVRRWRMAKLSPVVSIVNIFPFWLNEANWIEYLQFIKRFHIWAAYHPDKWNKETLGKLWLMYEWQQYAYATSWSGHTDKTSLRGNAS